MIVKPCLHIIREVELEQMRLTALKFRQQGIITARRPMTDQEIQRKYNSQRVSAWQKRRKAAARLAVKGG